MYQNFYNASGYDQFQPPQLPVIHQPSHEMSEEILQARNDLMEAIQAFLKEYDHIPPDKKYMALLLAKERFLKIQQAMEEEQNQPEVMQELLLKLMNDLQMLKGIQPKQEEQSTQSFTSYGNFSMIDNEKVLQDIQTFLRKFSRIPFGKTPKYIVIWRRPKAITPDEPFEEPEDPLIMGEEELSTIPEKDKSSVEDLVPIPSGSKGLSDDICDVSSCDNDHFDAESLLSRDIPITSPKIDFLSEEFAGKLTPILPDIHEADFDEEEDICDDDTASDDDSFENIDYVEASPPDSELVILEEVEDVILHEKLSNVYLIISKIEALNDNPTLSSFSYSDNSFSDHMEETMSGSTTSHVDISLPGYDSFHFENEPDQGDLFRVMENNDDSISLPEYESFHFDLYDVPSFPRPPLEPPNVKVCFNIQPDTTMKNDIFELYKDEYFDPGGGEIIFQNVEDDDSFTFVIQTFLLYLTYPANSSLLLSTRSEDTSFDPGISAFLLS
ncbi:hypothetical protein Tco_0824738 [Tanacetum coccineum]|uniref:Uncharacterized protein n=1 Tax=Tanacetum coccineum TaxID=301880 RepID=A0ABQ5AR93_9ASTR